MAATDLQALRALNAACENPYEAAAAGARIAAAAAQVHAEAGLSQRRLSRSTSTLASSPSRPRTST